MKQKIGARESFTVAQAAHDMKMSIEEVEDLISRVYLASKLE